MTRSFRLEVINSAEEWKVIRECYVQSFFEYPLYKYMVPDRPKREEFLRAYFDANYEVTVKSGQAVLLGLRAAECDETIFSTPINSQNERNMLVGGLLLVFPSSTGKGWAIQDDEVYWQAYEKHQLPQISKEGMERVKRYEAWEFATVTAKLLEAGLPMFNGLFCAMLTEYTSQGIASKMFEEGLQLFSEAWTKQLESLSIQKNSSPKFESKRKTEDAKRQSKESHLISPPSKNAQTNKHLNHNDINQQKLRSKGVGLLKPKDQKRDCLPQSLSSLHKTPETTSKSPQLIGICHGKRSVHYYKLNGFQELFHVDYNDEGFSFTVFVLALDLKKRGVPSHSQT